MMRPRVFGRADAHFRHRRHGQSSKRKGLWVDGTGLVFGASRPAAQVARRGIFSSAKRKMSCPQHDVGK